MLHGVNKYTSYNYDTHNLEKNIEDDLLNNAINIFSGNIDDITVQVYSNGIVKTLIGEYKPLSVIDTIDSSEYLNMIAPTELIYELKSTIGNNYIEDYESINLLNYLYEYHQELDYHYNESYGTYTDAPRLRVDIIDKYFSRSMFLNIRNIKKITRLQNKQKTSIIKEIEDNPNSDGFVILNTSDSGTNILSDIYAVRNPNQVKSATDNIGTYSKENNDIRLRKIKEDEELFLENGYSENWIKNATEEEKEVAKYCIGI